VRIIDAAWTLARERGLAGFSLRDLGNAVGMRAPSLFVYFAGKNDLYDAMFEQGWREWVRYRSSRRWPTRTRPRARVRAFAQAFTVFALEEPVRYQLLHQRLVPGFEPSPGSWQVAVEDAQGLLSEFASLGVDDPAAAFDLWTAMLTGLLGQQIANDPGGTRWTRRVGEVVDLWCDRYGIAGTASD
jgi:AcrR family transcriptional regulator